MKRSLLQCLGSSAMVVGLCAWTPDAYGSWFPNNPANPLLSTNHKMHYPQLPDTTTSGLDVNATFWNVPSGTNPVYPYQKLLADDWRCSETGPVADVHIWGSWLNNQVSTVPFFKLSIHSDIPKSPTNPDDYSRPGAELWSRVFTPGNYDTVLWPGSGATERFYDPNTNTILGADNQIFEYNFVDITHPFFQEKDKIYWLDVQVLTEPQFVFGWKTSASPHFNDDAVFADTTTFGGPPVPQFPDPNGGAALIPWKDMHYPEGPLQGQSIDLAFVITPEPASGAVLAVGMLLGGLSRRRR